jgi:hypothetical protein
MAGVTILSQPQHPKLNDDWSLKYGNGELTNGREPRW